MLNIKRFKNRDDVASAAMIAIGEMLSRSEGRPTLFLVSGGSSMSLMNSEMPSEAFGSHLTSAPLDERVVFDPSENNSALFKETEMFQSLVNVGGQFIDAEMNENDTKEDIAKRYNDGIQKWLEENPEGRIVATMGIGSDGHVCGMMPFPNDTETFKKLFIDGEPGAVLYDASGKNEFSNRITVNMPMLERIDEVVVYVVGEKPLKDVLKIVDVGPAELAEMPARIIQKMKNVHIFTDIAE